MRGSWAVLSFWLACGTSPAVAQQAAAKPEAPRMVGQSLGSGWILTPPVAEGRLSEQDRIARESLQRLVDRDQHEAFRAEIAIAVPERPTGLPGDYDVLVYGQLPSDQANRLEIKVRGGRATAEYVSTRNELRRGDIPADSLDSLTRQLLYAAMSTHSSREERHTDLSQALSHSSLTADRLVDYRIEVISRDSDHPLHLKTEPRQAISRRISGETAGVHGYAHTRFCQTVLRVVWDRLSQQPLTPELGEDFARRLRELADRASAPAAATSASKQSATSLFAKLAEGSSDEVDLSRVEGLISVQLIVACRARSALRDLERMGFRDAADELRFETAENSRELLQRALEGRDLRLHLMAARMLTSNPTPQNVALLVESLPRIEPKARASSILRALMSAEVTPSQVERIKEYHGATQEPTERLAVARLLLWKSDDDMYHAELVRLALAMNPQHAKREYPVQLGAALAVFAHAVETGKRRAAALELLRTLIDRIPGPPHVHKHGEGWRIEMRNLGMQYLGLLGEPADLPRLAVCIGDDTEWFGPVQIVDIARLDADAALKLARARIERYAAGKPETVPFLWWVEPYLGLVFWQRDEGSVGPLAAALEKYRRTALEHDESLVTLVLLQKYLTEKDADERARLATDFVRLDRPNSTWVVDVGKRLLREGADPKRCQPLLEAKPHVRMPISALEPSRTWPISTRGR